MRTALVTGVSRRAGIGFAVARRLLDDGYRVAVHSWAPHDAEQPWGGDDLGAVLAALDDPPHLAADLADPDAPARLVRDATAALGGRLDVLVANHARSSSGGLADLTAAELDAAWAVNARAVALLVGAFAAQPERPDDGRAILFTSGQHRGAMPEEIAYAIAKGAVHQMTRTLAHAVGPGLTVNAINPGPVDTGWADAETLAATAGAFRAGRWGRPEDIARVVAFLAGPDSGWVTGQVLDADGGFAG